MSYMADIEGLADEIRARVDEHLEEAQGLNERLAALKEAERVTPGLKATHDSFEIAYDLVQVLNELGAAQRALERVKRLASPLAEAA